MNKYTYLLCLFLYSCHKSPWSTVQYQANSKAQSFVCIHYEDDRHPDIRFEILADGQKTQSFLEIHRGHIPPHSQVNYLAQITVTTDQQREESYATLMQGGQKILLEEQTTQKIIEALRFGNIVTIGLDQYEIILHPKDFLKKIQQLKKNHQTFVSPKWLFEWPE